MSFSFENGIFFVLQIKKIIHTINRKDDEDEKSKTRSF